jgi:hypothetical protein
MKKIVSGNGKVLNGDGLVQRPQHGVDQVFTPHVSTEVLIKMDHVEWLQNFAKVMQLQTGVEMTPMRAGVISRCNLAAEYIQYLKVEVRGLETKLADATKALGRKAGKKHGEENGPTQ